VNGKIFDETPFRELYIQPAAYDGGTAWAALCHHDLGAPEFVMDHAYWGPDYDGERMRAALEAAGVAYERCRSTR
jgi:carbamoyltransferase